LEDGSLKGNVRKLVGNLPAIAGLLLSLAFSIDVPFLRSLKTEETFGLWVVVLVPLAILLFAAQLVLWWSWSWTRPWRTRGGLSN